MREIRLYQNSELNVGQDLILDPDATHHAINVLRLKTGFKLTLFNGQGGEYKATIKHIAKKHCQISIDEYIKINREIEGNVHLAQCVSKGDRMDYAIQKAVELGVTDITPIISERCNVKLDQERWEKRLQHWTKIAINACEQSGRTAIPTIHAQQDLREWCKSNDAETKVVLAIHGDVFANNNADGPTKLALLVGPEGGLTEEEVAYAKDQGFQGLNLGPRVLRTETATVVGLTLCLHQ